MTTPKPSRIKVEYSTHQSFPHADPDCGSNFDGLATTLQRLIQQFGIINAIYQVRRCIGQRNR